MTRANYDTWLRDTIALRHDADGFVIGAPNDFAREWLTMRLRPMISRTLARVLGHKVEVMFEVLREPDAPAPALLDASEDAVPEQYRKRAVAPPSLNPLQTFGSFVVGDENRIASDAAARAVEQPGVTNPLLIFGASGLGKTHLLNAIGHAAYERGVSVIYASAERFGNDYVKALSGNLDAFRARYRERRSAAHRRRPVPRGEGEVPGGVLPYVQRAPGRRASNRRSRPIARPRSYG